MSDTVSGQATLLSVKDVVKHYSMRGGLLRTSNKIIPAVDGVSFDIEAGTTMALVGESGCGKSTLAKLVLQLERPDSGEIKLDGTPIKFGQKDGQRLLRRNVQIVFQDPYASLTPHLRINTILREPFQVHKICPPAEINSQVAYALDAVGLSSDIGKRYPHELSGGQRQRIGIARAIAIGPRLVVCDEPVSALDVSIRSQIINLLLDLQKRLGFAYLFISHDLGLVEHISDTIAVMYLGKIIEKAPHRSFFAGPKHPYSAALLASTPPLDPRQVRRPVALHGEISSMTDLPSGCRFRVRCPLAVSRCADEEPVLRQVGDGHFSACHRAQDVG
jgi:oligopeptide/dipeptide ABC transporter ATP-binding protein